MLKREEEDNDDELVKNGIPVLLLRVKAKLLGISDGDSAKR